MKRILFVFLTLFLLVSLSACAGPAVSATDPGTPAADTEASVPDEYPLHEEYRDSEGVLLWEAVTDRSGDGFLMTTTYYDAAGNVTGILEDSLDENKALTSSRSKAADGSLLSVWSSVVQESGSEEHISYYRDDAVLVTTDRYFDDLSNETGSISSTWFGFQREIISAPTSDLPQRLYTRCSLKPVFAESSDSFDCYDTPDYRSGRYAYSVAEDGSVSVVYTAFSSGQDEEEYTETWTFGSDFVLLSKEVVYPDGYTVKSFFDGDAEIVRYDAEDGSWNEYRTDTQTGQLSAVLSFDGSGTVYQERRFNDAGYLTEDLFFMDGKPHGRMVYSYDDSGRAVRTETFGPDGSKEGSSVSLYNEDGILTGTEHYDGKDELLDYSVLEYNENGFVVSETIFAPNCRMREKYEYTLDEYGNKTGYSHYGDAGQLLDQGEY